MCYRRMSYPTRRVDIEPIPYVDLEANPTVPEQSDPNDPRTVLVFQNLHWSVTANLLTQTITRFTTVSNPVLSVVSQAITSEDHSQLRYKSTVICIDESIAAHIAKVGQDSQSLLYTFIFVQP